MFIGFFSVHFYASAACPATAALGLRFALFVAASVRPVLCPVPNIFFFASQEF